MIKILFFLLLPAICLANIYQYTDPSGTVVYTDQYQPRAKKADLPTLGTFKPKTVTELENEVIAIKKPQIAPSPFNYTKFAISRPANEETLYNQPEIEIAINVQPKLQPGHQIVLFLNGKPTYLGKGKTSIIFKDLDRGEYKIYAQLIDAMKKVLKKTPKITIYVHHTSIHRFPKKQLN